MAPAIDPGRTDEEERHQEEGHQGEEQDQLEEIHA
jgi:hypothetical protein